MKLMLTAVLLLAAAVPSHAKVAGKLDLANPVFDVIVFRELNDGMWLGGAQKTIWKLQRVSDGKEVMHVAVFWATRPELNSHKVYGPSLGFNLGGAISEAATHVAALASLVDALPPFVGKIGNWTSLDIYGGYRPTIGYDEHHLIYGVGGKVQIPLDLVFSFISKAQGGGL
jgi:hypothetical protein